MKSIILKKVNTYFAGILFVLLALLNACQTENTIEEYNTKSALVKSSPLTNLIKRVAMSDSNSDNIIDNSNYFRIKFPYSITINGSQIALNSPADYAVVQNNIKANTADSDVIVIHFPIVVLLENYTERTVFNENDFNSLVHSFQSNASYLGKINGLTIQYPIRINSYNSASQMTNSININDNLSLFNFTENVIENQYFAFNYPIQITSYTGQNLTVNSNENFENEIKEVLDNCPENEIFSDFIQTLTTGSWKISYFFADENKSNLYANYILTFNSNNTVTATKNGTTKNGTWATSTSNNSRTFNLVFNSYPFSELNQLWTGFEFNTTKLRFRNTNQGSNETDYLYLQKN